MKVSCIMRGGHSRQQRPQGQRCGGGTTWLAEVDELGLTSDTARTLQGSSWGRGRSRVKDEVQILPLSRPWEGIYSLCSLTLDLLICEMGYSHS